MRLPAWPWSSALLLGGFTLACVRGASVAAPPAMASAVSPASLPPAEQPDVAIPEWIRMELADLALSSARNAVPLTATIQVVISRTRVVIDGTPVAVVSAIAAKGRPSLVDEVFSFLVERREKAKRTGEAVPDALTCWIDGRVPALVVKSVFQTAAFAGFPSQSFAVRRAEAPSRFARLPVGARIPGPPGSADRAPVTRVGTPSLSGRLPPEVIQQTVRQNYTIFRHCYEAGLGRNPQLAGRVSVRFVIGRDGKVTNARDEGSTLPDPAVVSCVVEGFTQLEFPEPEGGIVTVVYPIQFEPG